MTASVKEIPRERILRAAGELLRTGGRVAVTTRSVSTSANVQPQTIYRQFGDMDGLLDAAAQRGFHTYLQAKSSRPRRPDPVEDLADGWDLHVDFGLSNPALYLLMYGEPDSGRVIPAAAEAAAILRELVDAVARAGRLRIGIDEAAAMIHSTGIGVVITLIGMGDAAQASPLSAQVRDAVLGAITTGGLEAETSGAASPEASAAMHAIALRALVDGESPAMSPGERLILDELLGRIGAMR